MAHDTTMKLFSYIEQLKLGPLLSAIHHIECATFLAEAETQQLPLDKGGGTFNEVLQHPFLDLPSLFDQRREYGHTPTTEACAIQDFIDGRKDDIKVLKSKLSDTISTISRLSRELSETSYHLAQRQDQVRLGEYLLSPPQDVFRSVPQDILEQIFLASLELRDSYTPSPLRPPLQLASVCHRWRTIALSISKLWEDNYMSNHPSDYTMWFYLARSWIPRCPSYRLTIRLRVMTAEIEEFTDFLVESPSRIRLLDIQFSVYSETSEFWSYISKLDYSELQELVFRDDHRPLELPTSATHLKRLYMHDVPPSWENSSPPTQLVVLSITYAVHWTMLEHILVQCGALECILITVNETGLRYSGSSSTTVSHRTTLHHLKTVCFINKCREVDLPTDLLSTFAFPVLTALEYFVEVSGRESLPWLTSLNFIHHLRQLTLHITDFPLTILHSVLNAATSIEEISIGSSTSNLESILDIFASLQDTPELVPHLRGLRFVSQASLYDLNAFIPSFTKLIKALSSSSSSSRTQHLTHLNIESWGKRTNFLGGAFITMLDDTIGYLNIKVYRSSGCMGIFNVPLAFALYVPLYNEIREHTLLLDGNWEKRYGRVRIVE